MAQTRTIPQTLALWPPVIPREHGSWGTFGGLILTMVLVAGVNVNVLLTIVAGVALFLAREPLSQGVKLHFGRTSRPVPKSLCFWAGVYLAISGIAGGVLLLRGELWGLLWLAAAGVAVLAVHLTMVARRLMMTAWGEWIGVLGVSFIIPALYLAAYEKLDVYALGLWIVGLIQVTGPIFYIRLKVRIQARAPEAPPIGRRLIAAWRPLLFSTVGIAVVMMLGNKGWVPELAWLALIPSAVKHLWGAAAWTRRGRLNVRRLGWIEVANILFFAFILGVVYRIG